MKNPLLAPELRELLLRKDSKSLRDFCVSSHPDITADFLSALSSSEAWNILNLLDTHLQAEIFGKLEQGLQVEILKSLHLRELAQVITNMALDERVDLLKRLKEIKESDPACHCSGRA